MALFAVWLGVLVVLFSAPVVENVPIVGDVTAVHQVLKAADAIGILKSLCLSDSKKCKGQSDKAKNTRAAVKLSLTTGHLEKGMSDTEAENLLVKTLSIKKTLLKLNGLDSIIDPADTGLLGRDILLTSKQADTLLSRLTGIKSPVPDVDLGGAKLPTSAVGDILGRKRRSNGISLDYYRGNRWPSTNINYHIDTKMFNSQEAATIRSALSGISSVSCIKFIDKQEYPLIDFVKAPKNTDAGTCGWSIVGYQPSSKTSEININFASSICSPVLKGVITHEILHALGLSHEHNRYDRDKFIKINWNNVDPQQTDVFDVDDPNDYNPYGVTYDVLSIMHYDIGVGAVSSSKPSFMPIKDPSVAKKIGNGVSMTANDAKLLKRLYCTSSTCRDSSPKCGWNSLDSCKSISSTCQKSCGSCDSSG